MATTTAEQRLAFLEAQNRTLQAQVQAERQLDQSGAARGRGGPTGVSNRMALRVLR
jgi:hypothetical protein